MKESTALTRHFAHQGLKIKLRTGGPLAATGKTKQGSPMSAPKTGGMKEKKKGKWMDDGGTDALLGADGRSLALRFGSLPRSPASADSCPSCVNGFHRRLAILSLLRSLSCLRRSILILATTATTSNALS
jgi:hypothetical protein